MPRQMKDSGIEWIGEIPFDWTSIKIKHTSWLKGRIGWDGLTSSEYRDDGPYLITGTNFNNGIINWDSCVHISKERYDEDPLIHIIENDLLITKDGTVGKVAVAKNCPDEVSLNSGVLLIRNIGDYKYDSRYLFYVLISDVFWKWYTLSQSGQSTIKHLYQEQFYNFEYPYPAIEQQHIIANFLDSKCAYIDSVIEKTKASIEEYKKLKQAIITEAVTKGVRGERPMKDSGIDYIGRIPEEWSVASVNQLFSFIGGFAFQSEKFVDKTTYQVIRIGNVKNDRLVLDEKDVYVDKEYAKLAEKAAVRPDDILFTMTGTKGKQDYFFTVCVREDTLDRNLYLNQRVGCFRKKKESINMDYYNQVLKVQSIKDYIFLYETGTANQGNLGIETIKKTKLFVPTYQEQCEIAQYIKTKTSEMDRLIERKEEFLLHLDAYKKSLIYEYVTGKKEVLI